MTNHEAGEKLAASALITQVISHSSSDTSIAAGDADSIKNNTCGWDNDIGDGIDWSWSC